MDLKQVAQTTAGMTGADLENLLNEAAIFAARDSRPYIMQEDIRKAFVKVGIGAEKKSRVVSEKEKRITAYHEAGHAILFHVLPDVGPVYSVSIIPTGIGAAGYTMPLPEKDEMFNTKGRMLQDIQVSLGGRIAEELVFDDITTGASQDIKQATRVARAMVTKYGMSDELGLVSYDSDEEVFIGRDFGHTKTYGEDVAGKIDAEIKRIVDECYAKAKKIILDNRKVLDAAAELLLQRKRFPGRSSRPCSTSRRRRKRRRGRRKTRELRPAGKRGGKAEGFVQFVIMTKMNCEMCIKTKCNFCEVCAHFSRNYAIIILVKPPIHYIVFATPHK